MGKVKTMHFFPFSYFFSLLPEGQKNKVLFVKNWGGGG
jgi:hypothetical protein